MSDLERTKINAIRRLGGNYCSDGSLETLCDMALRALNLEEDPPAYGMLIKRDRENFEHICALRQQLEAETAAQHRLFERAEKAEAEAMRYRYLRDHCSSHYAMTHDQPAEWSIGWGFQQRTPQEACGSFDYWIDCAIARLDDEDWAALQSAPPTDTHVSAGVSAPINRGEGDRSGEKQPIDRPWDEYPVGTKAHAVMGGHWIKEVTGRWKWFCGSSFPTPGGDACAVTLPTTDPAPADREKGLDPCRHCGSEQEVYTVQACPKCDVRVTESRPVDPAPADRPEPSEARIDQIVDDYEFVGEDEEGREGRHDPTDTERVMLKDFAHFLLSEINYRALSQPVPAVPDAVRRLPEELRERARHNKQSAESLRRSGQYTDALNLEHRADTREDDAAKIDRALADSAQPVPAVPEGYVLVPKEPTQAMCDAGEKAVKHAEETGHTDGFVSPYAYAAMIAAAPTPAGNGEDQ